MRMTDLDRLSFMLALVIIYKGEYPVLCAEITDVPNKIGMIYEPLNITCTFTLDNGDEFDRLQWLRKRSEDSSYVYIALILGETGNVFLENGKDLENRSSLALVNGTGIIDINRLECCDAALYKCELSYIQEPDHNVIEMEMTDELKIQATPQNPSRLDQLPTEVAEFDNITFECQSDVGASPPGSIAWDEIRGNDTRLLTGADNVTFDTVDSCTKTVVSTLVLNVSRDDNDVIVRCRTTHPNLEDPSQYLDSKHLVVNYPVEEDNLIVSQSPNQAEHEEGTSVYLSCNITTIPSAMYTWYHVESNTTHDSGLTGVKHFIAILTSDGGTYTCEAVNSYFNLTFTALKNLTLIVRSLTTTPPAETTTLDTTTLSTTPPTTTSPTTPPTTTLPTTPPTTTSPTTVDATTITPDTSSVSTTIGEITTIATMATSPDDGVTDANTEPDDEGLSGGVIAGIIIGSLVAIGVASVLTYLLIKRPKKGSKVEISQPAVSGRLA